MTGTAIGAVAGAGLIILGGTITDLVVSSVAVAVAFGVGKASKKT